MGDHINTKKDPHKRQKRRFSEGQDPMSQRKQRVSFKSYIQHLEEDLLEEEFQDAADDLSEE
jgi:hypothetical protein